MNGTQDGALDGYIAVYEMLYGESPSIEDRKYTLGLLTAVKTKGMDPILLTYIADVRHQKTLAKLPGEISNVIADGLEEIRQAIPTGSDLANRLKEVETFRATMERAENTMAGTAQWLATRIGPLLLAFAIIVAGIMSFLGWQSWKVGYTAGYANRSNDQACAMLGNVFQRANRDRDGKAKKYLADAYDARCR